MAASYPSAVKSFAARTNGQTIAATHVGDLQDEVAAIEGGLLNGFPHALKASAAGGQDLGSAAVPWANGYFTGLPMDIGLCEGRLTLTSGTAVTTTDVTGATSIYFTPYKGNRIALYDGSNWALYTFTELTLALGTLTSAKPYDVFVYNNSGTLTLEALVWTDGTTRATALALQNGIYVKTGATTRRYLGTFYTTATTTTEDSFAKRYLWNYYNRVDRPMQVVSATTSYNYSSSTIRQAQGSTTYQLNFVIGVAEGPIQSVLAAQIQGGGTGTFSIGFGLDTTTVFDVTGVGGHLGVNAAIGDVLTVGASITKYPSAGVHFLAWLEASPSNVNTFTVWSANSSSHMYSGIRGVLQG